MNSRAVAIASPPQTPPIDNGSHNDGDADSFGRSTRSQIRLKVTHRGEEGDDDDDYRLGSDDEDGAHGDGENPILPAVGYRDDPEAGAATDYTYTEGSEELDGEEIQGQDDDYLSRGRIKVGAGRDWDDSEEESDDEEGDEQDQGDGPSQQQPTRRRRRRQPPVRHSYLHTFTPSRSRTSAVWLALTNPGAPNTLSIPHVSANLFAASLHPSVLLSTPFYFDRTGTLLGVIGLIGVGILGGVGGGLWVVLSRYVGGKKTVEAITGASFGRNTKWKGRIGKAVAGILLACYATGSAFLGYFAIADLLLQIFFHYSPRGIPLHDRAFVTLVMGGLFTAPLIIFPLHKRTLIRLATATAVTFYPIIITILLVKIYTMDIEYANPPGGQPEISSTTMTQEQFGISTIFAGYQPPNANPLYPPSIWAPYSLLPVLTLSSSPLQILAHNRSLRRKDSRKGAQRGSNVKAFLAAQAGQVVAVVGVCVAFGIGMGTKGIGERLGLTLHPNLFATLPRQDHLINLARLLFVLLLSSHLALCLAVARSSWARLLKLFNLNPFKWKRPRRIRLEGGEGERPSLGAAESQATTAAESNSQWTWAKLARVSLGGTLLWTLVATLAFFSGVGGIRRSEKKGEEARYVRSSEVLGLFGGAVGFVLPALVWIILFHIRSPRGILPLPNWAKDVMRDWAKGDLGALSRRRRPAADGSGGSDAVASTTRAQTNPIPTWHDEQPTSALLPASSSTGDGNVSTNVDNSSSSRTDPQSPSDPTRILLARKERQLQKRTKSRRLWQDVLVLAAILPFGIALLVLGAVELSRGGY